jgi:hypothetical protein
MDYQKEYEKARAGGQSVFQAVSRARVIDLTAAINQITPLLEHEDPDVKLRASQEIRALHDTITKIEYDIQHRVKTVKRKPLKKAKSQLRQERREGNIFRPPI